MKGIVSIGNNVQVIKSVNYNSRDHREEIIKGWKVLYRDRFYYCWIQIDPYTTDNVKMDGTNAHYKTDFQFPEKKERPPAEYSNQTTVYDE